MRNGTNGTAGQKPERVTKHIFEIEVGGGVLILTLILLTTLGIFRGCGLL